MQITIITNKYNYVGGYRTGSPLKATIDAADICAVSYFKDLYAAGKSVHLKDGTAYGTIEPLADILARVANTAGLTAAQNIQVIVHDKTPGQYGFPHTRLRTTGDRFSHLEI